jgi:hypothetical protein
MSAPAYCMDMKDTLTSSQIAECNHSPMFWLGFHPYFIVIVIIGIIIGFRLMSRRRE